MSETSRPSNSSTPLVAAGSPRRGVRPLHNGRRDTGSPSQSATAKLLLNVFQRYWKAVIPTGILLAVIAGSLVYLLFEPVYEASAWLKVDETATILVFENHEFPHRGFLQTQIELIRSPLVLGPVATRLGIAGISEFDKQEAYIQMLSRRLEVNPVGQSELLKVSFESTDPENSARTVNAVVDSYFDLRDEDTAKRMGRVIELLEDEQQSRSAEVARLRKQVQELNAKMGGLDSFAADSAGLPAPDHPLASLQDRLNTAEVEQEILVAQIRAAEEMIAGHEETVSDAVVARAVGENPEVLRLRTELLANEAKLHEIEARSTQGTNDPFYLQLQREISRIEKALREIRSEQGEGLKAEMETSLVNRRKEELVEMQFELERQRLMEQMLRERYEKLLAGNDEFPEEALQLQTKSAELARAEEVFDLITARVMKLKTEQRAPARVTLLRPAVVPVGPVEAGPYETMLLASFVALCLPFGLVFLRERIVRRVVDARELEQQSNLTIIAETPRLPIQSGFLDTSLSSRIGRDLVVFTESVDGLRTLLMLSEPSKDIGILAVTSATSQEGKTSIASQLAASISRALKEPVLLIDGDTRAPDIHNVFEIPLGPGLTDVLAGECSLEDAIVTGWSKHMHVLPAGELRTSPHKLFGNEALASLLKEIGPSYRYVVIDTPPVLPASEALVLSQAADAFIMCAMQDHSRTDQVNRACERFAAAGIQPIGTVLNGVPSRRYSYRYNSAYYPHR